MAGSDILFRAGIALSDELLGEFADRLSVYDQKPRARLIAALLHMAEYRVVWKRVADILPSPAERRAAFVALDEQLRQGLEKLNALEIEDQAVLGHLMTDHTDGQVALNAVEAAKAAMSRLQEATAAVVQRYKPRGRRKSDLNLEYTVGGLMFAIRLVTGQEAHASQKTGRLYGPRPTSPAAEVICGLMAVADSQTPTSAVANMICGIRSARKDGDLSKYRMTFMPPGRVTHWITADGGEIPVREKE